MPLLAYDQWPPVGSDLAAAYPRPKHVTVQDYRALNPLEHLVVPARFTKFFGTKVLNLFVAGVPYGWAKDGSGDWQDNWPPAGLEQSAADHLLTYPKFAHYKTWVFVDFNFVAVVERDNPDSRIREMMDAVEAHFQELVPTLPGFAMGPRIEDPVGASFFRSYVDDFYAAEGS